MTRSHRHVNNCPDGVAVGPNGNLLSTEAGDFANWIARITEIAK